MNVTSALIVAGGLGSRMKSVDATMPKELLPVNKLPIILLTLKEVALSGISDVIFVINSEKKILRDYLVNIDFSRKLYPESIDILLDIVNVLNFKFVYQEKPKGEVDAIRYAESFLSGQSFAIIYPDEVHLPMGNMLSGLCERYNKYKKNIIGLSLVDRDIADLVGNTGKVDLEELNDNEYKIKKFYPKTSGTYKLRFEKEYRTCGYMITRPEIFKYISEILRENRNGEVYDFYVREKMICEYDFIGYYPGGKYYDVGNLSGYYGLLDYFVNVNKVS